MNFRVNYTTWFLPSALIVNVMKDIQAQVNGGGNYDSLKVAKGLVIYVVTGISWSTTFLLSLFTI